MGNLPIIDTEMLKVSFTWALCLKQLFIPGIVLVVLFIFYSNISDYHEAVTRDSVQRNYPSVLDSNSIEIMREMERRKEESRQARAKEEELKEQEVENRKRERKEKISSALSARSETSKTKLCSQCGATYGTGSTCQYCGQP